MWDTLSDERTGSVISNYHWSLPAQSFMITSPAGLITKPYSLRFETPLTWRVTHLYLYPQGVDVPVISPGARSHFRRLLWHPGLLFSYSNLLPRGRNHIYINAFRTSQETHYVSTTKPNELLLFKETVAIYCNTWRRVDSAGRIKSFGVLKLEVHIVTTGL
jgi:hypothetical protein